MTLVTQVEYRRGMLKAGVSANELPTQRWNEEDIPPDAIEAFEDENVFELGGTRGDKDAGDPPQYDWLRIVTTGAVVEIEVFNRALALLFSDDETMRRIHRVLCTLDDRLRREPSDDGKK